MPPYPGSHWLGTVYHGLPEDLYTFRETPGTYLAFLGRISPEKGVEQAIAIAQHVGMPLKIAAKVDRADREYFQEVVQPLLKTFPGRIRGGGWGRHQGRLFGAGLCAPLSH